MKYLIQFGIILVLLVLGQLTSLWLNPIIQIPGSIIGMIYLLLALLTGIIKEEQIKDVCDFFLTNMIFLFIPSGVGIIASFVLVKSHILDLGLFVIGSTSTAMFITFIVMQIVLKKKEER